MTVGERDPAATGDWPLGRLIRPAVKRFRSERAVVQKSKDMGPDFEFSRGTLRNYSNGFREDGVGGDSLVVSPDTVRRIAAVLELDPREALDAAGLHYEAERQPPPRTKADVPLDSKEVTAAKLATLPYSDRLALQHIIDSLVAAHADTQAPETQTVITSVPGGEAWEGHESSAGYGTKSTENARG